MKIACVTGVAGGIGSAVAELLLEKGFSVVGLYNVTPPTTRHEYFTPVQGSIDDAASRERLLNTAIEKYGRLDVLVNVAGVAPKVRADLLEMTEESYDRVMGINTKGTLFLTQSAAKLMLKNEGPERGVIVNISSLSAYTSSTGRGEYCISKAGVSMITTLFADRLADEGIMVNEVRPGIIATGMTAVVKEKYDALIEGGLLPIKRWGMPEDIAKAVLTLCDGSLPYMTGQALNVDGGFHLRRL